jgi:hypothetical protein
MMGKIEIFFEIIKLNTKIKSNLLISDLPIDNALRFNCLPNEPLTTAKVK